MIERVGRPELVGEAVSGQLPKAAVSYEPVAKTRDQCVFCVYFAPPQGCDRVRGEISEKGWCKLFRRKGI